MTRMLSPERLFVNQVCKVGDGLEVRSGILYQHYRQWCRKNRLNPCIHPAFMNSLLRLGYIHERRRDGIYWLGLSVPEQEQTA